MKLALAVLLLAATSACFRTTRSEKREEPVDTGVLVTFGDEGGPSLHWEFSDGNPPVEAKVVQKAFARAGHYVVQGKEGTTLRWKVELDVVPRPLTRAVPVDAEWVAFAPTVEGDLNPVVDFFERVFGMTNAQSFMEGLVLPVMAVEASAGGGKLVDVREGMGVFTLPSFDGFVVLLGVVDEAAALDEVALKGTLIDAPEGTRAVELRDGTRLLAFTDRGYVYAAFPRSNVDVGAVVNHVREGDGRGFEQSPAYRVPGGAATSGRLVVLGAPKDKKELPIDALWATLTVGAKEARIEGLLQSPDVLWQTQGQQPAQLFTRAWEGPVAAASVRLPVSVMRALMKPGTPEREKSRQRLLSHGIDIDRMFRALTGEVGGIVWFDAEAFLKNLIDGTERPDPRGAALVEVAISETGPWEAAVGQMLEVFLPVKPKEQKRAGGTTWTAQLVGQPAQLSVGGKTMRLEMGSGLNGRTLVDLSQVLSQRFDGAFSKGHASVLIDLGRLRAELETPRMIDGLDAMRVVTTQGFASAFLDQLTPLDHVLLDLAPVPGGAKLKGRIVLKEKVK